MNSKSIYKQFYQKLIFATSLFVITISFIFYGFTKATIYEEIKDDLVKDAQLIHKLSINSQIYNTKFSVLTNDDVTVDIVTVKGLSGITFTKFKKNKNNYLELLYPFDMSQKLFIKIVKNTNSSHKMLNKIFNNIFLLSLGGLIMVILYAFTVSKTLLKPILQITDKLSNMNENFLMQIEKKSLPIEFHPLADSINNLTNRIQTFIKYQKELFIGTAHELKTPLAVMKLKNEVTLMKRREPEKYEETLKVNISSINDMNTMISSILDMGRQEGAQFEQPVEIDIVEYMYSKCTDYQMLAESQNVILEQECNVEQFITVIQPTLLNQIIQNFIQNAMKFTPNGKKVIIKSTKNNGTLTLEVIDEGTGIDESLDLFAPFKRVGEKQGAGLGLFLAKSAADALGAKISLENRKDGVQGAVATLILQNNPACKI